MRHWLADRIERAADRFYLWCYEVTDWVRPEIRTVEELGEVGELSTFSKLAGVHYGTALREMQEQYEENERILANNPTWSGAGVRMYSGVLVDDAGPGENEVPVDDQPNPSAK